MLLAIILAALGAFIPNDLPPGASGEMLYQAHCAACHAAGPRHPGTQSLQIKYKGREPAALVDRADLDPDVVKAFVRNGVHSMPSFRKTEISDADLNKIAAYLAHAKP